MVSPRKTDVMPARKVEPVRRVTLARRAELTRRVDTACSVAHHKRAAAVLLKKVDAELLRRVAVTAVLAKRAAVVPLKREAAAQLKRVAIAARRVDITAPRCSLA
jgi:hypothetical protein